MGLGDLPEYLRAQATRAVTGQTPEQLYSNVDQSVLGPEEAPDRRVHALASQLAAERLGPHAAYILGSGKELVQGLGSTLKGEGFFGTHGYDPGDMRANEVGIMYRGVNPAQLQALGVEQ